MQKVKEIMEELLYKNHVQGKSKIESIEIVEIYLLSNKNECIAHSNGKIGDTFLHIKLNIKFIPIINSKETNNYLIHDDVKLALMKY